MDSTKASPTFASILDRVHTLADEGRTWDEAWGEVAPAFKLLSDGLTDAERSRAFESLLASFTSDAPHPVEPVGQYCAAWWLPEGATQ